MFWYHNFLKATFYSPLASLLPRANKPNENLDQSSQLTRFLANWQAHDLIDSNWLYFITDDDKDDVDHEHLVSGAALFASNISSSNIRK